MSLIGLFTGCICLRRYFKEAFPGFWNNGTELITRKKWLGWWGWGWGWGEGGGEGGKGYKDNIGEHEKWIFIFGKKGNKDKVWK